MADLTNESSGITAEEGKLIRKKQLIKNIIVTVLFLAVVFLISKYVLK